MRVAAPGALLPLPSNPGASSAGAGRRALQILTAAGVAVTAAFAVARYSGSSAGRGHIPIIALTAHAMKGAAEQCTDAGMDAHLTKPIDRAQLQACLGRYLDCGISDGFAAPTAADDGDKAPVNRPALRGGVAT